jgi:thiamine pyrophosphate-dependent acetolactate synthase large subunit-like protein
VWPIVPILEEAFFRARNGVPGPVFVEFPLDTLYKRRETLELFEKDKPKGPGIINAVIRWYISRHATNLFSETARVQLHKPFPVPQAIAAGWQVAQAVKMLGKAKKPVLIIGAQAAMVPELTRGLVEAVETIGAPVWLSSCGRGLLGAHHPLQFRHCRSNALREADVVVLAGVVMDFRLGYGMSIRGATQIISINLDKTDLFKNRTPTLAILADPAKGLAQIGQGLRTAKHSSEALQSWVAAVQAREDTRAGEISLMAQDKNELINPVYLCQELENIIGPDACIVADGGDIVGTFAYNVRPRGPRKWLDPGAFGTLGVGGGFAIGYGASHPNSELWIIWGDGACGFSIAEFDTMVRMKIPCIAVVGNDACWTQIVRDQVRFLGRSTAGMLTYQDYHLVAKGFGAEGILISKPEDIHEGFRQAKEFFAQGKPVLVNCLLGRSSFREGSLSM